MRLTVREKIILIYRDEYYAWGLHQISKAVSFLSNDCKLVHLDTNNSHVPWEGFCGNRCRVIIGLVFFNVQYMGDVLQVHGNLCLASVVVTPTLDWKLHGLGVLSEFDGGNPHATGPMLVSLPHSPISEFWHCQSELRKVCNVRKTSVVAVIVDLLLVNVENEHGLHSATNTIGWLGHNTRLWS